MEQVYRSPRRPVPESPLNIIFLFIDGFGIGRRDPRTNPLFLARLPAFRSLCGGELPSVQRCRFATATSSVIPLDATLGVAGLPQSGTGQTALFTGLNAARIVGRHFGPHPYSTLKPMVGENNVFRQLTDLGLAAALANAYPERFFRYMEKHEGRRTVTTLAALTAGLRVRTAGDLMRGEGISADITGEGWSALGHPEVNPIEPADAGRRLVRLAHTHTLTMFEYWHTDRAGHAQHSGQAVAALERLDGMLSGILETMDQRNMLLVITSDHGNIEDLSVRTHTRNRVPLMLAGRNHAEVAAAITAHPRPSIMHVVPALLRSLGTAHPAEGP
jgi:2,3-bisphosphoglycerate-independent phosphoglycerate mutase